MVTKEEATKYAIGITKKYFEPITEWPTLIKQHYYVAKKWVKKLFWIIKNYDRDLAWVVHEVRETQNLIKDRTELHGDLFENSYYQNTIITIGRYKNRDYVEITNIGDIDFEYVVRLLKERKKYASKGRMDVSPSLKLFLDEDMSR